MSRRVAAHIRSNVVGYVAVFIALSGTAWALETNSVKSRHIVDGQVKSADVADDGLTGTDIAEAQLGEVPSAAQADTAQDSNTLDGQDSSDFLGADAAAGGDLSGNYPNPTIADGTVSAGKIGSLPAVRAYDGWLAFNGTSCQNDVSNDTGRPICYTKDSYDPENMHAADTTEEPTTKLTAPRSGLYAVSAGMIWTSGSVAGSRQLSIKKNGNTDVAGEQIPAGPTGNPTVHNVTGTVRLLAGDWVQAFALQNSGANLGIYTALDERSFFEMHWIGP